MHLWISSNATLDSLILGEQTIHMGGIRVNTFTDVQLITDHKGGAFTRGTAQPFSRYRQSPPL